MKNRRTIRLKGYDYSRNGAYFVTICTENRQCLFGKIACLEMVLNHAGEMVNRIWGEIPEYYPGIDVDAFQIMPNHIHGIIMIDCHPVPQWGKNDAGETQVNGQPQGVAPTVPGLSLPDVIHRFKTMTTKQYIDGVKQYGWQRFDKRIWQRNYYEHIIRNDDELSRIIKYINDNPAQWHTDQENPAIQKLP